MSISCKGEDHSEIEMLFHNELSALSNEGKMLYHGGLKHNQGKDGKTASL